VAGAYLMIRRGLQYLYDKDIPERGGVEVYFRDSRDQGTTGVIAAIATLITGAAPETGFGGIGAHRHFSRRDLLHFDSPIDGLMALQRRDNGRGVILDLDTSVVPAAREMQALFSKAAADQANEQELVRFAILWQDRVEEMLIRHTNNPALIQIAEWQAAA
jgi:hypothetical protein